VYVCVCVCVRMRLYATDSRTELATHWKA
jgi:hypothetical protein